MKKRVKMRKKASAATVFCVALVGVFLVAISVDLGLQHREYEKLQEQQAQVVASITAEEEKTTELENKREYLKSDAYIEEIAREQLGLVKPDEILFINRSNQ